MTAVFTFDESSHTYAIDGVRLPSVTQLLKGAGIGPDFSAVPPQLLEAARAFGVAVHSACELDDLGELDDDGTDARVMACVHAWRRFKVENDVEVLATEQRLYHPTLRYAGTLDGLVRMRAWRGHGTDIVLVDRKTGLQPHPSFGVQLAAYEELLRVNDADLGPGSLIRRASVHLFDDCTYRLHRFTNHNDSACFMACLALHSWKEATK